jgi:hypothetical protein
MYVFFLASFQEMNSIFQSLISSGTSAIAGLATASSSFPYQEVRKVAVHGDKSNQALIWDVAESNKVSFGSNTSSSNHPNNLQSFLPQNYSVFSRSLPKNSDLELELVKNGVKRWKMIRHPKCLAFKDGHQVSSTW